MYSNADLTSPCREQYSMNALMKGSHDTVDLSQMTARCFLARVIATFMRRSSARNPTSPSSLDLTKDRITASFSDPWNASTEFTSTSG
ncbi:hypothetical protein TNIN_146961 [Trichonephila inaurata madagascariensis]|uniref:Uncharacterized protein n=1 Tax=Trichonephila inaurata madagascariensis TaxID=2747483 RepID=A0A8X6Y062_9ARAC|nr:hypothetical protein TNIN_146961 [Trichonephila inaurata madagascariensis]